MVPPTHPGHPVTIEMVVIKQGFGGETWPPWNCRSSFSGTLKCQFKKNARCFVMFIFGIDFRPIISYCMGQFNMNELLCRWGETIICCSHPKAKLGNVRSTDTSDGIELTMEALCLHWTRTRPTSTGFRWFLHDIFLFEQNVNEPRRFLRGKWLQQQYEMYVQGNYSQAEQKIC